MRIKTAHLLQRIPATAALKTNGNLLGQEARVGIAINSARRP
jgi:tRNA U55 pseudouridine synthase TruB